MAESLPPSSGVARGLPSPNSLLEPLLEPALEGSSGAGLPTVTERGLNMHTAEAPSGFGSKMAHLKQRAQGKVLGAFGMVRTLWGPHSALPHYILAHPLACLPASCASSGSSAGWSPRASARPEWPQGLCNTEA